MAEETEELARVARGGVLLTGWAYEAGWPPGRVGRRLRTEGWTPICRGAWAAPGKDVDWRVRARAHQLMHPTWVCSHGTAAALHRIEVLGTGARGEGVGAGAGPPEGRGVPEVLDFTVRRPLSSRTGEGVRVRSTEYLDVGDCVMRGGLRATGPARTVGDLIRSCGTREGAVVVADSALSRRTVRGVRREPLVHHGQLAAELAAARPGAARARRALRLADSACGSPAETVARLHMRDAGLRPESQPLLRSRSGRTLRPDFLFRAVGLAVEIEGYAFHGSRHAHDRDIRRFNDLADCPEVRRVLRFTAREVFRRPDAVVATIRAAVGNLAAGG
ncbi:endonuclease domain-containing protein [Streptomyces sp. NPDC090127]|uniref:endonuclease domain-containing protein n=1 Tax=Streptomyces sp. NPDC090127 TaxID=3365953 RepID=UPI0037FBC067